MMGGGAAIRAAAKVAGVGVLNGGIRNVGAENSVSLAARKAASVLPAPTALVSPAEDVKLISSSEDGKIEQPSVQRLVWEVDDWELAGGEEEFVVDKVDSTAPRLVFGPAPSLEEAKEATSELKDALDKIYFSPLKLSGNVNPFAAAHEPGSITPSQPEGTAESVSCVMHEVVVPSVPKHAMQAFLMLKESPAAQNVVASIASDQNVWNAVLQNEALQAYLESGVKYAEFEDQQSPKKMVSSEEDNPVKSDNGFMSFIEDVKNGVFDMVNLFSDFIRSIFGGQDSKSASGSGNGVPAAVGLGGPFMALAVMVIMMIVMRRG
ncbi:hypothetical protein Ancab_025242 [Ancistrocladus abbreviatus]